MPKIDSMINAMANTASIATEFASAFSAADTIADTFATFARPINDYEVEMKHRPASQLETVHGLFTLWTLTAILFACIIFFTVYEKTGGTTMFVQATIQCECGCISRVEFQAGKHTYICPRCKKTMNSNTYSKLEEIMGEFGDLSTDVLKYSSQYGEPNMRAIVITIADLEDSNDPNEAFRV